MSVLQICTKGNIWNDDLLNRLHKSPLTRFYVDQLHKSLISKKTFFSYGNRKAGLALLERSDSCSPNNHFLM